MASKDQPIVIKKVVKGGGGGHHGGAWKVAYADFVTAMMAFFLLMWLINTTTPEQKRGIADYFAPASVSPANSGSGAPLAGTAPGDDGVQGSGDSSMRLRHGGSPGPPRCGPASLGRLVAAPGDAGHAGTGRTVQPHHCRRDTGRPAHPADRPGRPPDVQSGRYRTDRPRHHAAARRCPHCRAPAEPPLDCRPYRQRTLDRRQLYELSSDRANAARRVLQTSGISNDRIYEVRGKAGSEPLYPDDPYMPGNRRISIVLLREAPVLPQGHEL